MNFSHHIDTSDITRYATASARSDGLLLLCGGRDANSVVSKKIIPAWHLTFVRWFNVGISCSLFDPDPSISLALVTVVFFFSCI